MSTSKPKFFYKDVLGKKTPAIFKKGSVAGLDKPDDGFRIPLIYFSWGLLEGSRNLHHHPDNDELLLVLSGEATIRLYGPGKPDGKNVENERLEETFEVAAGDVVLFPQGWTHSVEDKGEDGHKVKVLVVFNNQDFQSVEIGSGFELPKFNEDMCLGENAH